MKLNKQAQGLKIKFMEYNSLKLIKEIYPSMALEKQNKRRKVEKPRCKLW